VTHRTHLIGLLCCFAAACEGEGTAPPPTGGGDPGQPPGAVITGVSFEFDTLVQRAEGSDNWAVTWADDGSQFTTWGDGGGFGGSDQEARVSLGVARIRGEFENFAARNVWGGKDPLAHATFTGKSYGVLALGADLWLWRTGKASTVSAFEQQDLFVSHDNGLTFEPAAPPTNSSPASIREASRAGPPSSRSARRSSAIRRTG
jgi:hypothetical protein